MLDVLSCCNSMQVHKVLYNLVFNKVPNNNNCSIQRNTSYASNKIICTQLSCAPFSMIIQNTQEKVDFMEDESKCHENKKASCGLK